MKMTSEGARITLSRSLPLFVVASSLLSIGSFLIVEWYDYDIWWHLVIGKDIVNRLAVPATDHFSVAGFGRPYHDSHWLFQVAAAAAETQAGFVGITALMVSLWAGTLYCTWLSIRDWVEPAVAAVLLFLAAMASMERFIPRPELVTFLMTAFFYLRLQQGKFRRARDIALLLSAQVLWTNSHGLFVFGPMMAGSYWLVETVSWARGKPSRTTPLGLLLVLLVAATLVNPYGAGSWEYAFLIFTEIGGTGRPAMKKVLELAPTFAETTRSAPAFWFFLALAVFAGIETVLAARKGNVSVSRILVAGAMLAVALTARRNIVLFALVAAPLTAEAVHLPAREWNAKWTRAVLFAAALLMLGWAWFPLSGTYYRMVRVPARFGLGATPVFFPYGLPEYLKRIRLEGNVYNSNNVGGFFLYHFYPSSLPLVDGRFEVYDGITSDLLADVQEDPGAFQEIVVRYGIRYVLLMHNAPEVPRLVPYLMGDPFWRLCYYDYGASFWARNDLAEVPPPADLSPAARLPEPVRVEDCTLLDRFLASAGSTDLRLRNLRSGLRFGQYRSFFLRESGLLQLRTGDWQEAERSFTELLRVAPDDVVGLNEMARIAIGAGDFARAEKLLKRAMELYPEDEKLKNNYLFLMKRMPRQ